MAGECKALNYILRYRKRVFLSMNLIDIYQELHFKIIVSNLKHVVILRRLLAH